MSLQIVDAYTNGSSEKQTASINVTSTIHLYYYVQSDVFFRFYGGRHLSSAFWRLLYELHDYPAVWLASSFSCFYVYSGGALIFSGWGGSGLGFYTKSPFQGNLEEWSVF
jgi:hypothetical protein